MVNTENVRFILQPKRHLSAPVFMIIGMSLDHHQISQLYRRDLSKTLTTMASSSSDTIFESALEKSSQVGKEAVCKSGVGGRE
jgi:hypothetical protein